MLSRRAQRAKSARRIASVIRVENLEARQLLSAAVPAFHPDYIIKPNASPNTVQGFTPDQIRQAYDINQIKFSNGTINGDGAGQTIAIVDAFNDPTLVHDVGVFDAQFNLPAINLQVVNQLGYSSPLPQTDAGWAGEISLDVEWAHAVAPAAKIILVEADNANFSPDNLLLAVNTAKNIAGVSVVSMSWGGGEFFSFDAREAPSELTSDSTFVTPAGHQPVTFLASAGDSGVFAGAQYPSASPRVISVGGTTLITDAAGNYQSETSWAGTNGGYSQYEPTPGYQSAVNAQIARAVPDVSYDADPNTGFAVYDTTAQISGGIELVGWQEVGGTSAGAPQWAAITAIANQGRSLVGKPSLDGPTEALPILYSLYGSPTSLNYSNYTSFFHDVVDTVPPDPFHFPFGSLGNSGGASLGYDAITGLGTPHVSKIVDALSSITPSVPTTPTPTGPGTPSNPTLPASPLGAAIVSAPTGSVLAAQAGTLKLRLTNFSTGRFDGPVTISLYATPSGTITPSDTAFQTITLRVTNIPALGSKLFTIHFNYPTTAAAGAYVLAASVTAAATDTAPTRAFAAAKVNIEPPTIDLAATAASASPVRVSAGRHGSLLVKITNNGNVAATGPLTLRLYSSADQALDASDLLLMTISHFVRNLKVGKSITLRLPFTAPAGKIGGSYFLIASASSTIQPKDTATADKTAVFATA